MTTAVDTMRSTILHIEHEHGLRLDSPQVIYDGPEHRIVRFFVEGHKSRELGVIACRNFGGSATLAVAAYIHERETLDRIQVRVTIPERFISHDGSYFIAARLDGPAVSVIVAAEDWHNWTARPQREGNDITAEVLAT